MMGFFLVSFGYWSSVEGLSPFCHNSFFGTRLIKPKEQEVTMANDYIQRVAIIAVFIGVSSTILSNFLLGIMNSRGLMNRWDIFSLIVVSWIIFYTGYTILIDVLVVVESKRPNFVRWLRRCGSITNIVFGVFVSIYLNSLVNTINFQSFGFTEVFVAFVFAIFILAGIQLVLEQYAVTADPRKDLAHPLPIEGDNKRDS